MKKFLTTAILLAMFATCTTMMAQSNQEEYLGLPGDNLNLYAVMKLFQESPTLETFEKNLNDENFRINNLDLNGDNFIDYIKVVDYVDRDVHNIVLQVAINRRENQDVAVFTVQRFASGQVQIQLIGDEALYGRNYIIEPILDEQYANQTPNPGYTGNVTVVRTTNYEIASWPLIRFIYMPNYVVWHSEWHWGFYPTYWHAWHPYYWHYYYGYHYNWYNTYYSHYHRFDHPRYEHWNDFYYSNRRAHSTYVSHHIESGNYRHTYSKPEQRRNGEELYARTNPDNNTRRGDNIDHGTAGRSDMNRDQHRRSDGTSFSTSERNYETATRSANNTINKHNSGSARRSSSTNNERAAANPGTGKNTGTARRSDNAANNSKSATSKSSGNSFSEKRSGRSSGYSPAGNHKSESGTAKSGSTGSNKSSKGESFSSRRNSGQKESVKTTKSSDNKKSSDTDKTSRRKQ
jgi:hypothetical protein